MINLLDLLLGTEAQAKETPVKQMANTAVNNKLDEDSILTIIGEVGPYGKEGMQWVASALRNRDMGIKGTYGKNNPNVVNKKYTQRQYNEAKEAWEESKTTQFNDAFHWFSDADLKQEKVQNIINKDKLIFIKRVGKNNFYKKSK